MQHLMNMFQDTIHSLKIWQPPPCYKLNTTTFICLEFLRTESCDHQVMIWFGPFRRYSLSLAVFKLECFL